jgi:hypothetical protein
LLQAAHHHDYNNNNLKLPTTPTRSKSLSPSLRCVVQPPRLRHKQERISNKDSATATSHSIMQDTKKTTGNKHTTDSHVFVRPNDVLESSSSYAKKSNGSDGLVATPKHCFEPINSAKTSTNSRLTNGNPSGSSFSVKNIIVPDARKSSGIVNTTSSSLNEKKIALPDLTDIENHTDYLNILKEKQKETSETLNVKFVSNFNSFSSFFLKYSLQD